MTCIEKNFNDKSEDVPQSQSSSMSTNLHRWTLPRYGPDFWLIRQDNALAIE